MNDQLNLEVNQAREAGSAQSQAQPSDKEPWSTPSLTVIDINKETEAASGQTNDGALTS